MRRLPPSALAILGQVVGQLSLVLVMPILTRQFSPSELGPYQIATAIAVIAQPVATLRVEFVIPSIKNYSEARRLWLRGLLWMSSLAALLIAVAAFLAFVGSAGWSVVAMTSLLVVGFSWTLIDNALLVRDHALRRLGLRNAAAGVLAAGAQVAFALAGFGIVWLAVALLGARAIAILATRRWAALKRVREPEGSAGDSYGFVRMTHSVASGVLAVAANQVLTLFAGWGYGASAGGLVGTAQRVAGVPLSVLGQGIGQVTQARTGAVIREGHKSLGRTLRRQLAATGAVAALCALALIVLAPPLAAPLLGDEWSETGVIIAILAVPLSLQLVVGPIMPILSMLSREKTLFVLQGARLLLVVLSSVVCIALGGDVLLLCVTFGSATILGYLAMLVTTLTVVRRRDEKLE